MHAAVRSKRAAVSRRSNSMVVVDVLAGRHVMSIGYGKPGCGVRFRPGAHFAGAAEIVIMPVVSILHPHDGIKSHPVGVSLLVSIQEVRGQAGRLSSPYDNTGPAALQYLFPADEGFPCRGGFALPF